MSLLVIALVTISALMHAMRDLFTKKSGSKQAFLWIYGGCSLILYLPIFIYFLIQESSLPLTGIYIALIAGVIHFLYGVFMTKSYDHGDLSHVYPIIRAAPVLVLIFSVLILKEQVSTLGIIGIAVVTIGVYILHLNKLSFKTILEPIKDIATNKASQFALITMLLVAIYSIIDKVGVNYLHPLIYVYIMFLTDWTLLTFYVFKTRGTAVIKQEWKNNKKAALINGFLVLTSYSLILFAFTLERVSYVVGLRQLSIVFAVLLGGHMLDEKNRTIRLTAAATIFAGAFLISIAS